ncbi:MAG TPA: hypothetical protein VF715_01680 [Thermoleophilaceae bacterium]
MLRGRTGTGWATAALIAAVLAIHAAPAGASEYTDSVARKVESEIVYVDPKAKPKLTVSETGAIRLRILSKAPGRIKIAVLPAGRAEEEGGASGLAGAIGRELNFRGALMVVAGKNVHVLTTHPESSQAIAAVDEAFRKNQGDRGDQILRSVDGLGAIDPGPSADAGGGSGGGAPGSDVFDDQADSIFDTVEDAIRATTLIIAAFFIIPILALIIWIALRVRRGRKESEGDMDFAQEKLRGQLIELGDEIRALEVDTSMPGVNALALSDYEAAVQQYDRANNALSKSEENPRYVGEAKAAIDEGRRRISDAKVRLGITPVP